MSNELRDTMATATGNFAAYTEQDLREARKFLSDIRLVESYSKDYADIAGQNALAAEFSRIRSEARAGMREACAKYFEDKNKQKVHAITWHLILRAVVEDIRNLLDTAADEAIERIKREARLEEATLWSRDKFHKTHSGYCDTLESHVKECSGCQRIAELSAQAKETR